MAGLLGHIVPVGHAQLIEVHQHDVTIGLAQYDLPVEHTGVPSFNSFVARLVV